MANSFGSLMQTLFVSALLAACGGATNISNASEDPAPLCAKGVAFEQSQTFFESIGFSSEGFEGFPDDVKCFTENAAMCEHFAGEETFNPQRQKEIVRALNKYCKKAQMLAPALKQKYASNAAILKLLSICDKELSTTCSSFKEINN